MKNTDYVTYMTTLNGRTWKWLRDKDGWKQIGPEGQNRCGLRSFKVVLADYVMKKRNPGIS